MPFQECVYSCARRDTAADTGRPIGEVVAASTVFARLVMLQTLAADRIAERKQKIIVIIVARAKQFLRLNHQILVVLQLLRRDLQLLWLIGENVEENLDCLNRRKIYALEIDTRVNRRIDQIFNGTSLNCTVFPFCDFTSRAVANFQPSGSRNSGAN